MSIPLGLLKNKKNPYQYPLFYRDLHADNLLKQKAPHPAFDNRIQWVAFRLYRQVSEEFLLNMLQSGSGWNRATSSSAWLRVHGQGWISSDGNDGFFPSFSNQSLQRESARSGFSASENISDQIPLSDL